MGRGWGQTLDCAVKGVLPLFGGHQSKRPDEVCQLGISDSSVAQSPDCSTQDCKFEPDQVNVLQPRFVASVQTESFTCTARHQISVFSIEAVLKVCLPSCEITWNTSAFGLPCS